MAQILDFNLKEVSLQNAFFIIDSLVFNLHLNDFSDLYKDKILLIDDAQNAKSLDQALKIINFFYEKNVKKNNEVYAIGGGSLTDLVGFAASVFKRGVDLVLVPTTLLAMVDASIGGKNGINYQGTKNLIGTFYPPKKVMIHFPFLSTLPQKELLSGLAEALKLGVISSKDLFENLCVESIDEEMIRKCINGKLEITNLDPEEKSIRHVLNFGHTIGHAYEACTKLPHGFCVALGIMAESYTSHYCGVLPSGDLEQIKAKIQKLYKEFPYVPFDDLEPFLYQDKKNQDANINIHVLSKLGFYPQLLKLPHEIIKKGYESLWM